ncbi:MAG TPA: hypothetical protein DD733_11010 [Clostridiales bacterium]|nr:hypothetical protein [Clostridiales bacterium]
MKANSNVYLLKIKKDENNIPDFKDIKIKYEGIYEAVKAGKILSAHTVGYGGIAAAVSKMTLGNEIGFRAKDMISDDEYFDASYGDIILEADDLVMEGLAAIGSTVNEKTVSVNEFCISLEEIKNTWLSPLNNIFPLRKDEKEVIENYSYNNKSTAKSKVSISKPKVFIPAFPGTNCEYDSARSFERAGAEPVVTVIKNLSGADIAESVEKMAKQISDSQIIFLPGGFSGGDEPDGSAKFITAFFRNPKIKEQVDELLFKRDGLMGGICNGFQALIKLGLVPFGEIREPDADSPTLGPNIIGRHQSRLVTTRIISNKSPWFMLFEPGELVTVAVSHGEGRFIATDDLVANMIKNGQITTQYSTLSGDASGDISCNPNGSYMAVEGISSPDGRIFGKMGHSERTGKNLYKNIPQYSDNNKLFEGAVKYFR